MNKKSLLLIFSVLFMVGSIRYVFLENASAYRYYIKNLSINEIGFRLRMGLYIDRFLKSNAMIIQPITPMGSSQVGNLFKNSHQLHPLDFPGASGFEYPYLARSLLRRFQTKHVLLFLSDIDLYFVNHPGTICDLPPRPLLETYTLLEKVIAIGGIKRFDNHYWHAWACNYLPEYRFASVFRTLLLRKLGVKSSASFSAFYYLHDEEYSSYVEHEKRHPSGGSIPLKTRLKFNLKGIESFIRKMNDAGIKVHIVQGAYNTSLIDFSNEESYIPSNEILTDLAARYEEITYKDLNLSVPSSDFVDEYHFTPRGARRVEKIIVDYLKSQSWQ